MPITTIVAAPLNPMAQQIKTDYNEEFIGILAELENYMSKKGEFEARAYQKKAIMLSENITNVDQISSLRGIGKTITSKLNEYLKSGKVEALEKKNEINSCIY